MIHPGLNYAVHLSRRSIRKLLVSAADVKPFHERPVELRHALQYEIVQLAWGTDIGLTKRLPLRQHRCIDQLTAKPRGAGKACGSGNVRVGIRTRGRS